MVRSSRNVPSMYNAHPPWCIARQGPKKMPRSVCLPCVFGLRTVGGPLGRLRKVSLDGSFVISHSHDMQQGLLYPVLGFDLA